MPFAYGDLYDVRHQKREKIKKALKKTFLDEPDTRKTSEQFESTDISVLTCVMQGWRKTMEDAHSVHLDVPLKNGRSCHLACLFDGHGGSNMSQYAAKSYRSEFVKVFSSMSQDSCEIAPEGASWTNDTLIGRAMEKTFQNLEAEMKRFFFKPCGHKNQLKVRSFLQQVLSKVKGGKNTARIGCGCNSEGTTALAVAITDQSIITCNIGDSRAILSRKGGTLVELSSDHKPQDPKEAARIQKGCSMVLNGRVNGILSLSRSIGDFDFKMDEHASPEEQVVSSESDLRIVPRKAGDEFVIMSCDGMWDACSSEKIVQYISKKYEQSNTRERTAEVLEAVVGMCIQSGDNVSSIMMQFNDPPANEAPVSVASSDVVVLSSIQAEAS